MSSSHSKPYILRQLRLFYRNRDIETSWNYDSLIIPHLCSFSVVVDSGQFPVSYVRIDFFYCGFHALVIANTFYTLHHKLSNRYPALLTSNGVAGLKWSIYGRPIGLSIVPILQQKY